MKLQILNSEEFIFFKTRDYALLNNLSISAATEQLKRLEAKDLIVKLTRGIWANPNHPHFSSFAAVPYLLNNEQGYVSFLTALNRHGILSQIPRNIQVATTGRSRILNTPIANYEFIQIAPALFVSGINWTKTKPSYLMASAEKALLDTMYLSTRRSNRFSALPELELESGFSIEIFNQLLDDSVINKRIKNAIKSRIELYLT